MSAAPKCEQGRDNCNRTTLSRRLQCASRTAVVLVGLIAVCSLNLPSVACALTPGQPVASHFPRLGLIWPDTTSQSLKEIARFDYVALHPFYRASIPALRAYNPDVILLTSANAAELPLDPAEVPTPGANDAISKVPNAWIQTQLGSTLAASVTTESQTFKVRDTTRFRSGDILVVGDELAKVVAVGTNTISVVRGLLPERSPAVRHAAGTRVAAAAVFWPGNVVMDLSDYCPRVTVDATAGPETWAEYNARMGVKLLDEADWDGIFIDRTNSNPYINQAFTRSIDPKRTNVPVTDGYAALNASWNRGLWKYESLVRAGAMGKVILSNNGHPYHDLLNGTILESFPNQGSGFGPLEWTNRMFGTDGRSFTNLSKCYSTFVASSQQPNLTTVETYEDDRAPSNDGVPADPSLAAGWRPNYQKMRFGLCSSLLKNGFFSYEIGTYGHASLRLLWFDEYDNVGQNQGYLGRSVGTAQRVSPPLTSRDLLHGDGSFGTATRLNQWFVYTRRGFSLSKTLSSGAVRVRVVRPSKSSVAGAELTHYGVPVTKGVTYTLSFRARASVPMTINTCVSKPTSPWTQYLAFGNFFVGTQWKTYSIPVTSKGNHSAARLSFLLGQKTGDLWLDDVKVQRGLPLNTYRRDFLNGIALVNPDRTSVTVPLGAVYKRLQGTQDPVTNNGAYVTSVRLPAQDGLILLKSSHLTVSNDRTIAYGTAAAISGSLKSPDGTIALRDRLVVLWSSSDKTQWTKAGETTTTASGGYSFTARPTRKRYYKVRYYGDADSLQGFSRVLTLSVRALASTPIAPRTMHPSRSSTVYGYLRPTHPAGSYPVRIYKYRYVSGRWRRYGYTRARAYGTGSYSKYARAVRLPFRGRWRLRAYHSDSGHAASWSSGYDYVTVK